MTLLSPVALFAAGSTQPRALPSRGSGPRALPSRWRSERDVAVLAADLRGGRDGPGERRPGAGGLDDLVDHAQGPGAFEAAGLPLVLFGQPRLDLLELVRGHVGERAPVQDPH